MEEVTKTEPKPNYIELSQDPNNMGNIFNELWWDLWDLTFAEKTSVTEVQKKEPILIVYMASSYLLVFSIIVTLLLSLDVFARSSQDNALFSNLPICSYLSYGVNEYENSECKTLFMIAGEQDAEKKKLEKDIITNLVILVPKLMQSLDIVNSPKVQFIQERTGDSRISINDTIDQFLAIKNKTNYKGEDISCSNIATDEKWKFSVTCQVYGGSMIAPTWQETQTSRETALLFLDRLTDPKSGFQVLSYPKTLDISDYSSTEGFKILLTTVTSLNLTLQYLPANKM